MNKVLIAAAIAVGLAGCQQSTPPSATVATSAVAPTVVALPAPASRAPVKFEVRDFKLDAESESYGVTTKGRGTLVTRDPSMAKGAYMVWISAKQAHKSDEPTHDMILMTDGIGTVSTFDYASKSDRASKDVKYYDWSVIGYVKLDKGVMVKPEQDMPAPTTGVGTP